MNFIQKGIAKLFAIKTVTVTPVNNVIVAKQVDPGASIKAGTPSLEGFVYLSDILACNSSSFKKSILFRAAGSVMATSFSAYKKSLTKRATPIDVTNAERALGEAASICIACDEAGQAYPLEVENLAWLANNGVPNRISESNAALLSEITGSDVSEIVAKNIAKRQAVMKDNMDTLTSFINAVNASIACQQGGEPRINMKHVVSAASHSIEWLSGWSDVVASAAEILLVRHDWKELERIAAIRLDKAKGAGESSREIDDLLLSAGEMKQAVGSGK